MYERATDSTILVQHNQRLCTVCVYFGKFGKYYFQLSYMYDWPRADLQMNEVSPYDIYMYKRNLNINLCEHTHVSYNLKQPTSGRL